MDAHGYAEPASAGALTLAHVRSDDGTMKYWLPLADGLRCESVLVPMHSYRGASWYTLCVSSQVGCRMGCIFCDTGRMGLHRNLTADEIVRQYVVAMRIAARANMPAAVRNVVFMGMGEPFDNFDAVIAAIDGLTRTAAGRLPPRRITVSTVGRIDGIRRLGDVIHSRPQWGSLRLAVSLNAAIDAVRSRLMPVNRALPLPALQRALLEFPLPRRGRFLLEYVLIGGVNDSIADADAVAAWSRPLPCIVNVIPYNPQRAAVLQAPDERRVQEFLRHLRAQGIFAKRRLTRGTDLMAACGQLGDPAAPAVAALLGRTT